MGYFFYFSSLYPAPFIDICVSLLSFIWIDQLRSYLMQLYLVTESKRKSQKITPVLTLKSTELLGT